MYLILNHAKWSETRSPHSRSDSDSGHWQAVANLSFLSPSLLHPIAYCSKLNDELSTRGMLRKWSTQFWRMTCSTSDKLYATAVTHQKVHKNGTYHKRQVSKLPLIGNQLITDSIDWLAQRGADAYQRCVHVFNPSTCVSSVRHVNFDWNVNMSDTYFFAQYIAHIFIPGPRPSALYYSLSKINPFGCLQSMFTLYIILP